jgi:hypothetical protein
MHGQVQTDSTVDPSIYTNSTPTGDAREGKKPAKDEGGTGASAPQTPTGPESPKDAAGVTGSNAGTVTGTGAPGSEAAAGTSRPSKETGSI